MSTQEERIEEIITQLSKKFKSHTTRKLKTYEEDKEKFFEDNSEKILRWVHKNIIRHLDNIDELTLDGYFYIRDAEIFFVRKEDHNYDFDNDRVLIDSNFDDNYDHIYRSFEVSIEERKISFTKGHNMLNYGKILNEEIKLGIYDLISKYLTNCQFTNRIERYVNIHGELIFLIPFEKTLTRYL